MARIYDPSFSEAPERLEAWADFVGIVRQLRRDCPWDREQTHESVKHLLIEEAYETVEAIDRGDWDELHRELGDLLLHVVFHAVIAEADGRFTLLDVVRTETEKLVRRHPHVFGDRSVDGVADVLANWEQIKRTEGGRRSTLSGVPRELPALLRAQRIQEKASGVGFDFPGGDDAWGKVEEELRELRQAVDGASPDEREAEFGDLLFALVNYARFVEVTPENALRRAADRFERRFRHVEERVGAAGKQMGEVGLEEMDRYWDEAKRLEREP